MRVQLTDPQTLRAAAWVAKRGRFGLLRLERKDDSMEIIGTDCYVMLQAREECEFEDWPDGAVVEIKGTLAASSVCKVIGGHFDRWRPLAISVDHGEEACSVEFSRNGRKGVRRSFRCEGERDELRMDVLERKMSEGRPEGRISSYMWQVVGQLMSKLPYSDWELVDHGPSTAFEFNGRYGRILAMPANARGRSNACMRNRRKDAANQEDS